MSDILSAVHSVVLASRFKCILFRVTLLDWCRATFGHNAQWRFCLCHDLRRFSSFVIVIRSSITKWVARISQKRFDLESLKFVRISLPIQSSATPDMTSPAVSCRKSKCNWVLHKSVQNGLGWQRVELFGHGQPRIAKFYTDNHTDLVCSHTWYDVAS